MTDETLQPKRTRQLAFLRAFRACGIITRAAKAVGIDRTTHYDWLADDPQYRDEFALAITQAGPAVEEEIFRRAMDGFDEPVFHQGKQCGVIRKFSDTLLIFAAKRVMPDKYRETVEHMGEVTVTKRIVGVALEEI